MILAKMREIAQVNHLIVVCMHQSSLAINPFKRCPALISV